MASWWNIHERIIPPWNLTQSLEKIIKVQKALISRETFCKNVRCNHNQQASSALQIIVMLCPVRYHSHHYKNVKNSHGGASLNKPATLLKITFLHRCFSRFKGTKSRKASPSQIWKLKARETQDFYKTTVGLPFP